MRYSITYDLMAPGKNYDELWKALRGLGAVRVLESQWLCTRINTTPKNIGDFLLQVMDTNDRIFVTEVPDNYAYRNLRTDPKAA